ncbi:MAG: hypothetical protein WC159_12775 [Sphaerochaetaceae bacterium]|jgi:hypothetical protein
MSKLSEFAIANIAVGKLNALVKNLMIQMNITDPDEAIRRVNSGEWTLTGPTRKWQEKDGVITFTVTSDGTTGPQWIKRLKKGGFRVSDYAEQLLNKMSTTDGVTTNVSVLTGELFFDDDRTTSKIRAEAESRGLTEPNPEIACLIREKFTDKELEEMGIWAMVAMHEPINDAGGGPRLLGADRYDGGPWLDADYGRPGVGWSRGSGFAFAAQV